MRTRAGGVQAKLFFVMSGLAVCITLALTFVASRWHEHAATQDLQKKAVTYGLLLARSVDSAIAFDDPVTAREELAAVGVDADISAIVLFREDGSVLAEQGDVRDVTARPFNARTSVATAADTITCRSAVVTREGPRGVVAVVVSKAALHQQRKALRIGAALVALAAILVGSSVAWWVARSMAKRIGRVAEAAAAVAGGELSRRPIDDGSADEIGQLASAFNTMVAELRRLVGQIEQTAAEEQQRLGELVASRTEALASRNAAMRLLLDHVGEGFVLLDPSGRIGPERSAIVDQWFGTPGAGASFWQHMERSDPVFAGWFELSWEALVDEVLPLDVVVENFPTRLQAGGRFFEVSVAPILDGGRIVQTLVDVRDVTQRVERERVENLQQEVLVLLERALDDRAAYLEFVGEAGSLTAAIAEDAIETLSERRRALHTLKGSFAIFGLTKLATFCHELESRLEESGGTLAAADRAELAERWSAATGPLSRIFSRKTRALSVEREDFDALLAGLTAGRPHAALAQQLQALQLDSLDARLDRFAEQATSVAARLDKDVAVTVDAGSLRFDPAVWSSFWAAFTHVVRNAVDHGIEPAKKRTAAGKPATGQLGFHACIAGDSFVLEVRDDGGGIDWSAVAERARGAGLPSTTPADLQAALFADGLSTRAEVSELSGRGVGLGAVLARCQALGGSVAITSQYGVGTVFRFAFPRSTLGDAYRAAVEDVQAAA